jgi:hypothetical protein
MNIPVVDDEVGKDELMWIEPERSKAKGKYGYPEIDQVGRPQGQRDIEEHNQGPHSKINTWASKTREKDIEIKPGCCKSTTSRNVTSTAESQIGKDRVSINLCREYFKNRGERKEMLCEAQYCLPGPPDSTQYQTTENPKEGRSYLEEGQERDHEDQED